MIQDSLTRPRESVLPYPGRWSGIPCEGHEPASLKCIWTVPDLAFPPGNQYHLTEVLPSRILPDGIRGELVRVGLGKKGQVDFSP